VVANSDGSLSLRGVAYNGVAGGAIEAVEVSADGGTSWHAATVLRDEVLPDDARAPHHWLRWVADVPLPKPMNPTTSMEPSHKVEGDSAGRCVVCCRAFDVDGQSQPRVSAKQRGYLYNGWFRVELTVVPAEEGRPSQK
jgi:hypothetical protein